MSRGYFVVSPLSLVFGPPYVPVSVCVLRLPFVCLRYTVSRVLLWFGAHLVPLPVILASVNAVVLLPFHGLGLSCGVLCLVAVLLHLYHPSLLCVYKALEVHTLSCCYFLRLLVGDLILRPFFGLRKLFGVLVLLSCCYELLVDSSFSLLHVAPGHLCPFL